VRQTDTLGRLSQVTQDASPVATNTYDDANGTVTIAYANGVTMTLETDGPGRITRVQTIGPGGELADYAYGYDLAENRTSMQRAHESGSPADVYEYDGLYQLTRVWYGANTTAPGSITSYSAHQTFGLDMVFNRLEVRTDGASEAYLPNNGLRLTDSMNRYDQVGAHALSYDAKGNLLSDGSNTYTYDDENRQVGMSGPGGTAEYVYDALGRRVARTVGGATTYFVYNAAYQVIEERDGSGGLSGRYTHGAGIDEVLTVERGGATYTFHRDALGSVTEVTDAAGALVERYTYDVYGAPTVFDGAGTPLPASAIGNPYLFTGRRYDPESANYYYRARMYSPELGRFSQMDPLGYVDGMNAYAYTNNNPVNRVDPSGRDYAACTSQCNKTMQDTLNAAQADYLRGYRRYAWLCWERWFWNISSGVICREGHASRLRRTRDRLQRDAERHLPFCLADCAHQNCGPEPPASTEKPPPWEPSEKDWDAFREERQDALEDDLANVMGESIMEGIRRRREREERRRGSPATADEPDEDDDPWLF
jgi:RHS repeat-associated protein